MFLNQGWYCGHSRSFPTAPFAVIAYRNPYVVPSVTLDYSRPIVPPAPQLERLPDPGAPSYTNPVLREGERHFEAARTAFRNGDYRNALALNEKALSVLPSDGALHEFQGLTLFARKQYREAASVSYAVLSAGPGWNWNTVRALYPDSATYTAHLRALEQYQRDHPRAAEEKFLLAYHYLVLGFPDQAARLLQQVLKLQPDDALSAELLKGLTLRDSDRPSPGTP